MRHLVKHTDQTIRSCHTNRATAPSWFWQILGITAFICVGLASEGLAATAISPKALTYYAVHGATNPSNQTISVSRTGSRQVTLTASDNADWLTVSPAKTSMTKTAQLTVAVNTSGQEAGTYSATITIKVGTWNTKSVPVTLIVSPATSSPPSSPPPAASTAALTWDAVINTPVNGYKVYVGEAPRLYTRTITVGNITSSTVDGLTVGRMYYFAVTAYNSAGESAPSNEVSKTIQ